MPTALCFDLHILTVCASTRWSQCEACDWGCSLKHQTLSSPISSYVFIHIPHHKRSHAPQAHLRNHLPDHEGLWSAFVTSGHISSQQHTQEARLLLHFCIASSSHHSHIFLRSELEYQTDVKEGSQSRTDPPTYCCLGFKILRCTSNQAYLPITTFILRF